MRYSVIAFVKRGCWYTAHRVSVEQGMVWADSIFLHSATDCEFNEDDFSMSVGGQNIRFCTRYEFETFKYNVFPNRIVCGSL